MDVRLDGRVVLVTGASQGVGEAIARNAARSGAVGLLLTARAHERGQAVAESLTTGSTKAAFVAANLADPDTPFRLVSTCLERFGRIDCLVNAAGLSDRATLVDADIDLWELLFSVNARAPFFLMQHAVRAMRERGKGGSIVNILSMNAHGGTPELSVYSATKAALALITKNAANAHRFDRIRVNGINMGWTDTPGERVMQADKLHKGSGWAEKAGKELPFGRLFNAEDVANLAVFLLSDAGGPMTGALVDQEQWVVGTRP